jgi:hypothetical protein
MRNILIVVALVIIVCSLGLYFYEIRFTGNDPVYDILVISRKDPNLGYGIAYKKGIEVCRFGYNRHGGVVEAPIWPK